MRWRRRGGWNDRGRSALDVVERRLGQPRKTPIGPDCAALYDCCDALPAADVSACINDMQAPCGNVPAYPYVSGFKGSTCAASCNAGTFDGGIISFIMCSQQSDCPTGTCTPIEPKGGSAGYCAVASVDAGG